MAEQERRAAVSCADAIRAAGLPCPVVSVGSTPTAHFARSLEGVTEVRAGVYVFFDLVMAGLGVCQADDIAASVLTTVIGHQAEKGWILVDAGWMAMSRDRGTAKQPVDQLYGLCAMRRAGVSRPAAGRDQPGAGHHHCAPAVARPAGFCWAPNCASCPIMPAPPARSMRFEVVRGASPEVVAHWERFRGW